MPSVYEPDNFSGRVSLAALVISRGGEQTRSFDTCFEMYDGDAVATALYRRVQQNPHGDLAKNLWRYLGRQSVEATAIENAHRKNLTQWARELREDGERKTAAMLAQMRAEQEARNQAYREELTEAGPQLVIPGCEQRTPDKPGPAQLSLFA